MTTPDTKGESWKPRAWRIAAVIPHRWRMALLEALAWREFRDGSKSVSFSEDGAPVMYRLEHIPLRLGGMNSK